MSQASLSGDGSMFPGSSSVIVESKIFHGCICHVLWKEVSLLLSEQQTALGCIRNLRIFLKLSRPPFFLEPSFLLLQSQPCDVRCIKKRMSSQLHVAVSNMAVPRCRAYLLWGWHLRQVFIMWKVCIQAILQGGVVPVFTVLAAFNSNLFLMKPSWNVVPKLLI